MYSGLADSLYLSNGPFGVSPQLQFLNVPYGLPVSQHQAVDWCLSACLPVPPYDGPCPLQRRIVAGIGIVEPAAGAIAVGFGVLISAIPAHQQIIWQLRNGPPAVGANLAIIIGDRRTAAIATVEGFGLTGSGLLGILVVRHDAPCRPAARRAKRLKQ